MEQHRFPNRTAFGECLGRHCGREARGPTRCADANSWVFGCPLADTGLSVQRSAGFDSVSPMLFLHGPESYAKREMTNLDKHHS